MPGVNDLPECKPSEVVFVSLFVFTFLYLSLFIIFILKQAVMDITVDSPNLEERDLYAYWHSPFSPYSVLPAIKDLYPTWTTGKVEDLNLFFHIRSNWV